MAQKDASEDTSYVGSRIFNWLDHRLDLDDSLFGKAFPEDKYGSFLLGEVALFSFIILALTGTFLGLLYNPSTQPVTYDGSAIEYAGQEVPSAFASVLHITYDTRLGMFTRMAHHWAAYLFVAAIGLHMLRVFFTGAYRNPHEPNWVVGSVLLLLALVEGFFGYALPYDNFSKAATAIGFQMTGTVPVIGTELQTLIFGGASFPGNASVVLPRMFFLHVFLLPAALVGGIGLHMAILMRQKHTEHANSSRTEPGTPDKDDDSIVTGVPFFPHQAAISMIVFFLTAAVISLLAAFFPVQRIAIIGPAGLKPVQNPFPDWFFMWVFGALKLIPPMPPAIKKLGISSEFIGGVVVPSLVIGVMIFWPFIDNPGKPIHFTKDPLARPFQTALGVAGIEFIIMLSIAGMKNAVADVLGMSSDAVLLSLRILTVAVPLAAFLIIYTALKRRKRRKQPSSSPGGVNS